MPIYEYQCEACNSIIEKMQSLADKPLTDCPSCSGALHKLISRSSFQLKGGGWFADGYGCASGGGCPAASPASSSETSSTPTASSAPTTCPKKNDSSCSECC